MANMAPNCIVWLSRRVRSAWSELRFKPCMKARPSSSEVMSRNMTISRRRGPGSARMSASWVFFSGRYSAIV